MTDAATAGGAETDIVQPAYDSDTAGSREISGDTGKVTESGEGLVHIGSPVLKLLGKTARALYKNQVTIYDRDMMACFDTCEYISEGQRGQIRDQCEYSIKLMNAYQCWDTLFARFSEATGYLGFFPLWIVCATAASALIWSSPPAGLKAVYVGLLLLFLLRVFIAYLRTEDEQLPLREGKLLALVAAASSGWLLFGGWSKLGPSTVVGVLLLSMLGTIIVTLVAIRLLMIIEDRHGNMGATAVYLAIIGGLAYGSTSDRPNWAPWLVDGIWSALWASLVVAVVMGALFLFSTLTLVGLWHRKNVRHPDDELVQTLTWLGLRLHDSQRPESERSELYRMQPNISLLEDLEYIAGLMQNYLPRRLSTLDPCSDSTVIKRCQEMAAAVRQLKLGFVLNQTILPSEIERQIVPAIAPISLGDWDKIAHLTAQEQSAPPRWKRMLRVLSKGVGAVVPLAALLVLRSSGTVSDATFAQVLPIVVTWLIVSIVSWIDPRAENNISGVKDVTSMAHNLKP
jgi:hypothetical protein